MKRCRDLSLPSNPGLEVSARMPLDDQGSADNDDDWEPLNVCACEG